LSEVIYTRLPSPIGELLITSEDGAITCLSMGRPDGPALPDPEWRRDDAGLRAAREQLSGYFAGELTAFDLPLAPRGTPFQLRVWQALREIPFGQTISYAELARRIGSPRAVRAVGGANGRNPIAVVVPCHRVIEADGSLTGFGGGVERKRILLELEGRAGDLFPHGV
jgi:methylated-DNA-[protein]-cysteine S-methyltransferase